MSINTAIKVQQPETDIAVLQVQVRNVEDKINDLKEDMKEIKVSIKEQSDEQTRLITDIKESSEAAHGSLSRKISALEKWRWMMMGAGVVIGALGFDSLSQLLK